MDMLCCYVYNASYSLMYVSTLYYTILYYVILHHARLYSVIGLRRGREDPRRLERGPGGDEDNIQCNDIT